MLNKPESSIQLAIGQAIGKRINRNIYSDNGTLLIEVSTILTRDHILLLAKHDIILESDDVTPVGPYTDTVSSEHERLIDDLTLRSQYLFDEIRRTKRLPLGELRNDIIPTLYEITGDMPLFELFAALQAKDDYTYRHNIAVGAIANLLGTWMGIGRQELLQLTTAALLHDVGKMLIPQFILNKPDRLTSEEYVIMKNHTVLGYEMMKETVGVNHRQALVALQHHERMDGSGYPFGLTYQKIEQFTRIVSVADVFHAMASTKVYRSPAPFYEVLFQMEKDAFGALDPFMTRLFIEKMMNGLIGHQVMLTDDSEGIIVAMNMHDPTHPLVQVGDKFIDLSKNLTVHIKQIL